ncbi:hypothetical protein BG015_006300, partial [Linnemannia schmuckeri]
MTYRLAPSSTKKTTKRKAAAAEDMVDNKPNKSSPPFYDDDEDGYEHIYNQIPENDLLLFLASCCPKCFKDPSK